MQQHETAPYSTVQYSTVQYSTVQYSTVQYSTVQYSTVQYSTVQYSTVQYSTYTVHMTLLSQFNICVCMNSVFVYFYLFLCKILEPCQTINQPLALLGTEISIICDVAYQIYLFHWVSLEIVQLHIAGFLWNLETVVICRSPALERHLSGYQQR